MEEVMNERRVSSYSDKQVFIGIDVHRKLGGFLARAYDRDPGPEVLWRGWTALQHAAVLGAIVFDS
jgi:hypothetical protein